MVHRSRSDHCPGHGAARAHWGWLYLGVVVALAAFGAIEVATVTLTAWARTLIELLGALVVLSVIAVWVHANRFALGEPHDEPSPRLLGSMPIALHASNGATIRPKHLDNTTGVTSRG